MWRIALWMLLVLGPLAARAQQPDTVRVPAPIHVDLSNIDVAPGAVDTKGWLLLDKDIQTELEGAIFNLYNFKYDKAEKQFRSLRRRYPQHPLPYLLMGMSFWWKIMPTGLQTKQYDKIFLAYMDTTIIKAEKLYKKDKKNYEACFFLSAAYGWDAQLNAERKNWGRATVSSRRALDYLQKSNEANGLSPEFLYGQALFNYYAVWISEHYKVLRPVLLFFPKGNRALGLQQLRNVADNGFYTSVEARFYLARILFNDENNLNAALPVARSLAATYPDNGYFQRLYALLCYQRGEWVECERISREILDKINRGFPGYEGISGRYATFFLGTITSSKDPAKAKDYFMRCIVFSESTDATKSGFYLSANINLARMADDEGNTAQAVRYYTEVEKKAEHNTTLYKEAKNYLQKQPKQKKK
ncbi:tol-pal system protein YbgF [Hymenobacter sp. BT175]|uniref:tetratricopeptide repeat protein n=1 Tax=Hymenobacter translucens TaxID=2886507 RepID=UPI001D0E8FC9|nr:tol-pal system protein YbgF [Hymenobacter translucens]MCC2547362.1 tol-pal system protein YbgF [Hymenobacter translucens]